MTREVVVRPGYYCPQCRSLIRARDEHWNGWVRCPHCERAALPPNPVRLLPPRREAALDIPVTESGREGVTGEVPFEMEMLASPDPRPASGQRTTAPRLIATTGLFVSLLLLLNAYLDRSTISMVLFGTLGLGFLGALVFLRIRQAHD